MNPQLVLSDELLRLYLDIGSMSPDEASRSRVQNLFSFYKPHLANKAQYQRIGKEMSPELETSLLKSGISSDLSLEDMATKTTLKLILNESRNDFPYVNISGDEKLQLNYTGSFFKEPREKCIAHLKSLFQNAMSIQVYDKYLYVANRPSKDNIELLSNILRLMDDSVCRTLTVYDSKPSIKTELERIAQHCKRTFPTITVRVVSSSTFIEKHDRYLIVNSSSGKVEILLSSGFENLFDNSKDFTYMIRPI